VREAGACGSGEEKDKRDQGEGAEERNFNV
jgi:hypothetical protein